MVLSTFSEWRTMRLGLLAVCASAALSACLPDDTDPAKAVATDTSRDEGAIYAATLGNAALQIQNRVVGDASWFTEQGAEHKSFADLGININGAQAYIDYRVCPTGNDREVLHITWINVRDVDGNFALKGVGDNASALMQALRSRVSAEQLGIYQGNHRLYLSNKSTTTIPASLDCVGLDIPMGAPVIAFRIAKPAVPQTALSRTEYRSRPCEVAESGAEQTGTVVEKRVVIYNTDGLITPSDPDAGWSQENMGQCLNNINIVAQLESTQQNIGQVVDSFANLSLRGALDEQIRRLNCRKSKINADNLNAENGPISSEMETDTCGDDLDIKGAEYEIDKLKDSTYDTMNLQCQGTTKSVLSGALYGVSGTMNANTVWSGKATLIRTRKNVDRAGKDIARISNWVGKPKAVDCRGVETMNITCGQINKGIPSEPADDRKWLTSNTKGGYHWRGPTGRFWNCATQGFPGFYVNFEGMDCIDTAAEQVTYLNDAYFRGAKITQNGGVTMRGTAHVDDWADPKIFKIGSPFQRTDHTMTREECAWTARSMGDCSAQVTEVPGAGSWDTAMNPKAPLPATYANTGPTLHWSNDTKNKETTNMVTHLNGLVNQVIAQYHAERAAGKVVSYVSRAYTKWTNTFVFWGGTGRAEDKGEIYYGPGPDLYLKSWSDGQSGDGQVTLNATARNYRKAMCDANRATGGYAVLCNPSIVVLDANQQNLTRSLCQSPDRIVTAQYQPGVSGPLRTYCFYIFDEIVYDLGTARQYRYHFREMAAPGKFTQTTLLNKDGINTTYRPHFVNGQLVADPVSVTPTQCARHEEEEIEVPITVRYRNYWTWWDNSPSLRPGTNSWKSGWPVTTRWTQFNTTAVFKKTTVREYDSAKGWSRPKIAWRSAYYGTFSSVPTSVSIDLSAQNTDAYCDSHNEWYSNRGN